MLQDVSTAVAMMGRVKLAVVADDAPSDADDAPSATPASRRAGRGGGNFGSGGGGVRFWVTTTASSEALVGEASSAS